MSRNPCSKFTKRIREVIFRAREAAGQMCYSGDMFDNWTYFGPVEMIEKDQYNKNEDGVEVTDEDIQTEIHHLTMAVKAAQLDDYPESHSESGHSGSQADALPIHPSHLANLYWEARAQGFHDLRGKLFTEELLRLVFKGIENVNITFSTGGCDSYLDRWGYIQDGPSVNLSCGQNSLNPLSISKDRYKMMLINLEYVAFDLKKDCQNATPDVTVSVGNDLVLIAIIANASDCEYKKIQQLHTQMLLSLAKHKTLFGLLVQGHQVYLAEYAYERTIGYQRKISKKAFKFDEEDLKRLCSYLHTYFMSEK
ncbi:uncharacterized protein LOC111100086 [Crassostrea virginica]